MTSLFIRIIYVASCVQPQDEFLWTHWQECVTLTDLKTEIGGRR